MGAEPFVDDRERTSWTPIFREPLAAREWLALRRSPVYRGEGVLRGDGAPVVLVHGFLTKGSYLSELAAWLTRVGSRARVAAIGWNAACPGVLAYRLLEVVRRLRDEAGRPVHRVGHSLGGVLSRAVAARDRGLVASVTVLGSPFRGLRIHPVLRVAARLVRASIHWRRVARVDRECFTFRCGCPTVRSLAAPLPADLPQLAVVTRQDGFVDWRTCLDAATMRVVEVDATHIGLAFNATVYAALARELAMPRSGTETR